MSDQVEPSTRAAGSDALRADPGDNEAMTLGAEPVFLAHGLPHLADLVVAELDHLVALGAVQVVVRGIAVIVLVGRAVGQPKFPKQTSFDEEAEGPIDGGTADTSAGGVEVGHELVGVEVFVAVEDMTD